MQIIHLPVVWKASSFPEPHTTRSPRWCLHILQVRFQAIQKKFHNQVL